MRAIPAARAGAAREIEPLVADLCRLSPEFAAMGAESNDLHSHGEGTKHIRHPAPGSISFEYSVFAVDGRPDPSMIAHPPMRRTAPRCSG